MGDCNKIEKQSQLKHSIISVIEGKEISKKEIRKIVGLMIKQDKKSNYASDILEIK